MLSPSGNLPAVATLQAYLRENARRQYDSVALPPFTLFFHPSDPFPHFSYAIPDQPVSGLLADPLRQLRAEFKQRGRTPRFEFFEAFAPHLPAALLVAGFHEEARQWSMICTPTTLQPASPVAGLVVTALYPDSPEEDITAFLLAQRQGFNPSDETIPSPQAVQQARRDFDQGGWQAFLACVGGQPAAAAVFARIIEGITEIAGVATRPAFRRRGIAAFLTFHLTAEAFRQGAGITCLTAASPQAGKIYERAGYRPLSTMLSYSETLD